MSDDEEWIAGPEAALCAQRGYRLAPFSRLQTDSSCRRQNLGNANEIVGGCGENKEPLDQRPTAMAGLAQTPDGLDPAERFLDPLALDCTDAIAGMTGGAAVDRRTAVGIVLRNMRRAAALTAAGDKVGGVICISLDSI